MADAKKKPRTSATAGSEFEQTFFRKGALPTFEVGDTVDVMVTIREGDKERVQTFNGTVIGRRGRGLNEMFTVRRIVQDEGVERTFPVNSPKIAGLEVKRKGRVRRAKLNYLRKRTGQGDAAHRAHDGPSRAPRRAADAPAAATPSPPKAS